MILILCLWCNAYSQQPVFENLKSAKHPYLQYNDVTEYNHEILFVTNKGICKNINNEIKLVLKKENLVKFIKVKNELFVWSIFGEFFKVKKRNLSPLPFNNLVNKRLQNKIINSVVSHNNNFWISTVVGGGVVKIDQDKEEVKTIELQGDYPYYVTQFGDQFLSGNNSNASQKQLAINFNNKPFFISLAENLSSSKTNVLKLKDGSFIFTRQYEAIRFNSKKIINRVFAEKNIESIFQSMDGNVWFTLNNGGVVCYTDGKFNSSSSVRYLGNKTVISITEDHNGNMWFGTSGSGVYLLNKTLKISYKAPNIFSKTNSETEEIIGVSILSELPISDSSSTILRTDILKSDTIPPVVFINNIKINGVDTSILNYYELNHNENTIELNISGIFSGKSELQYKYILEGKERKWNYTTNTDMYYTSLKPGNYTFKVVAMSDGGIWSKIPAVITFSITPPIYTSFWFLFSIIFLIIAIMLLLIFFSYRKAQRRKTLFEEDKKKVLLSELHALRSQMNPHFIFNTLSSIQSFITKNNSRDAVNYLSKFSKLMRGTLENTQRQKIPIKDEIETLELYMDLEKLRLNNKFDFKIIIDEGLDVQFEEIPPMLIQPYLENAIWHGISHKETEGLIKICFVLENENLLRCEIIDDGVGRKKATDIKNSQRHNEKNKSFGMSITKDRLEIINSLKDSKLNINIVDLEENNRPTGTKIEIFIPLD
ncbi:histidine kinase [Vicingaceae bacterium]|nr:histidine kinase [Vicingaceae bacterium]